jgi:hypothetical protein
MMTAFAPRSRCSSTPAWLRERSRAEAKGRLPGGSRARSSGDHDPTARASRTRWADTQAATCHRSVDSATDTVRP